jgi:hypothetical protein
LYHGPFLVYWKSDFFVTRSRTFFKSPEDQAAVKSRFCSQHRVQNLDGEAHNLFDFGRSLV